MLCHGVIFQFTQFFKKKFYLSYCLFYFFSNVSSKSHCFSLSVILFSLCLVIWATVFLFSRYDTLKKALQSNVCHSLEYEERLFTSQVRYSTSQLTSNMCFVLQPQCHASCHAFTAPFLTGSKWRKVVTVFIFSTENVTCTCRSVHAVIFGWTWRHFAYLIVLCVSLFPLCPDWLMFYVGSCESSAAPLAVFQMCVIRKDMKSVQDRLLTQMVSGLNTFGSSVSIRPQQSTLVYVPLSCIENNYTYTIQLTILSLHITHSLMLCSVKCFISWLFLCVSAPFAARGGDPECEERSACFVFPLKEFSVWQNPTAGTHS